jgi:hypothetical protein
MRKPIHPLLIALVLLLVIGAIAVAASIVTKDGPIVGGIIMLIYLVRSLTKPAGPRRVRPSN